jgi:predicted lipoprotein with Yx(FWY)xxD motif
MTVFACRIVARRPFALLLAGVVSAACAKKDSRADTAAAAGAPAVVVTPPGGPAVAVAVPTDAPVTLEVAAPPGTGVILTDANGRPVYVLEGPGGKPANCTGDCAANFTPVPGHAVPKTGDTAVKASLSGGGPRPDGTMQATYNGKPLYYYRDDTVPGAPKGAGQKVGGATSYLVNPQGNNAVPANRD